MTMPTSSVAFVKTAARRLTNGYRSWRDRLGGSHQRHERRHTSANGKRELERGQHILISAAQPAFALAVITMLIVLFKRTSRITCHRRGRCSRPVIICQSSSPLSGRTLSPPPPSLSQSEPSMSLASPPSSLPPSPPPPSPGPQAMATPTPAPTPQPVAAPSPPRLGSGLASPPRIAESVSHAAKRAHISFHVQRPIARRRTTLSTTPPFPSPPITAGELAHTSGFGDLHLPIPHSSSEAIQCKNWEPEPETQGSFSTIYQLSSTLSLISNSPPLIFECDEQLLHERPQSSPTPRPLPPPSLPPSPPSLSPPTSPFIPISDPDETAEPEWLRDAAEQVGFSGLHSPQSPNKPRLFSLSQSLADGYPSPGVSSPGHSQRETFDAELYPHTPGQSGRETFDAELYPHTPGQSGRTSYDAETYPYGSDGARLPAPLSADPNSVKRIAQALLMTPELARPALSHHSRQPSSVASIAQELLMSDASDASDACADGNLACLDPAFASLGLSGHSRQSSFSVTQDGDFDAHHHTAGALHSQKGTSALMRTPTFGLNSSVMVKRSSGESSLAYVCSFDAVTGLYTVGLGSKRVEPVDPNEISPFKYLAYKCVFERDLEAVPAPQLPSNRLFSRSSTFTRALFNPKRCAIFSRESREQAVCEVKILVPEEKKALRRVARVLTRARTSCWATFETISTATLVSSSSAREAARSADEEASREKSMRRHRRGSCPAAVHAPAPAEWMIDH